eukprot:4309293-Pleurochrysis_carterae.AAC.1
MKFDAFKLLKEILLLTVLKPMKGVVAACILNRAAFLIGQRRKEQPSIETSESNSLTNKMASIAENLFQRAQG